MALRTIDVNEIQRMSRQNKELVSFIRDLTFFFQGKMPQHFSSMSHMSKDDGYPDGRRRNKSRARCPYPCYKCYKAIHC